MKGMTLANLAKVCGGQFVGDKSQEKINIKGVAIDSRLIEEGFLFIPIKGERVDGHTFINQVFEKGAVCSLSEHPLENMKGKPYIIVKSTENALKIIAGYYRRVLGVKVVGVSGSVGKTSTKEMIGAVLSTKYNVFKTEGNYNGQIGLPLSIFKLKPEHQVAVLEMGISEFGEMHRLSNIAKPDVCVITNIGICHLETLGTRDGILKAKTEMFDYITSDAKIILNGDDDKLSTVKDVKGIKPVFFGNNKSNDIYYDNVVNKGLNGISCDIHYDGKVIKGDIHIPGEHMAINAAAATAVGKAFGLTDEEIAKGLANASTISGRCNVVDNNGINIIDDCYNANPVSMKAGIDLLSSAEGRKIAILGDMFELGTEEKELHYEVGKYAAEKNVDRLICIGELSEFIQKGAQNINPDMKITYRPDKEGLGEMLKRYVKKGDSILVKASHGMHFEEIVEILKKLEL